jgi:hypothetical protein
MTAKLWKRESDYQLARAILRGLFEKGLLTEEELEASLMHIKEQLKPPISGLAI